MKNTGTKSASQVLKKYDSDLFLHEDGRLAFSRSQYLRAMQEFAEEQREQAFKEGFMAQNAGDPNLIEASVTKFKNDNVLLDNKELLLIHGFRDAAKKVTENEQ